MFFYSNTFLFYKHGKERLRSSLGANKLLSENVSRNVMKNLGIKISLSQQKKTSLFLYQKKKNNRKLCMFIEQKIKDPSVTQLKPLHRIGHTF